MNRYFHELRWHEWHWHFSSLYRSVLMAVCYRKKASREWQGMIKNRDSQGKWKRVEWVDEILEHTVWIPGETSCVSFESHLDLTVHELWIKRIHNYHLFSSTGAARLISEECISWFPWLPLCSQSGQCGLKRRKRRNHENHLHECKPQRTEKNRHDKSPTASPVRDDQVILQS